MVVLPINGVDVGTASNRLLLVIAAICPFPNVAHLTNGRACVCRQAFVCRQACACARMRACVHVFVSHLTNGVGADGQAYVRVCVHASVHVFGHRSGMCACVDVRATSGAHIRTHTHTHTHAHTYNLEACRLISHSDGSGDVQINTINLTLEHHL